MVRHLSARPVRVLRVITRLNVGGPAHQALLLTDRLRSEGFETLLVTGQVAPGEADMRDLFSVGDIPVIELAHLGRRIDALSDARSVAALARIVARFRPHVVHTHMAKAGALGRAVAWLAGTRVIVHTFHGNVLRGYFGPFHSAAFAATERALARISTRVLAISSQQRAELARFHIGDPARVVQIPLGLDLAPFRSPAAGALRSELHVRDVPLVGMVARLVPIKHVDLLLRAFAIVRASVDARLVIVGDGELRPELEKLSKGLGIDRETHFLGWRADLPAIYADLDVVALTSRNEGFPVSLIEAMTAGRAVVATNVGGVGDLVGSDTGLLVPPDDAQKLAGAILSLLQDADRRRLLGKHAAARVYPEHDAATLVRRIANLYRDLLERR